MPNGMRYYFGAEARLRRHVEDTAMSVFDGWSYEEITTPSVDYYSLFEFGMGHREARRAFRFTDTDGRMLALMPDVTSSVARAASTLLARRARPLRLCYAGRVFRQQPPSHAQWRRESEQVGCEHIGSMQDVADVEALAIAVEVLKRLRLDGRFSITLNDVGVFNGVAEQLALDPDGRDQMRRLIDVRDAAELRRFLAPHTRDEEACSFARLVQLPGKSEVLADATRLIKNPRSAAALGRLGHLWGVVESLRLTDQFEVDLGDLSGLDYYTGLTFKIYVEGVGSRAGGGGRYDTLIANFGRSEPAVGFVLDLDAIAQALSQSSGLAPASEPERTAERLEGGDTGTLFLRALEHRAGGGRVLLNVKGEA
ncbi:MAG: ATP phosphoribosyltransferase regulatory subunit [Acidobacteria bacterium]|nr:ATP phosphoribosyltransferase regulatory subunit [Acidobacteriota bacterium]